MMGNLMEIAWETAEAFHRDKITNLHETIAKHEKDVALLRKDIELQNDTIERIECDNNSFKNVIDSLKKYLNRAQRNNSDLQVKNVELKAGLRHKQEALENAEAKGEKRQNQIQETQKMLGDKKREIAKLERKLRCSERDLEKEKEHQANETKQSSILKAQLEHLNSDNSFLQTKCKALEDNNKEQKEKIKQLEHIIEEQEASQEELNTRIEMLAIEKGVMEQMVKGQETEKAHLQKCLREKEERVRELQNEVSKSGKKNAAFEQEVAGLKEMKTELEYSVKSLERKDAALMERIKVREASFDERVQDMRRAQEGERKRHETQLDRQEQYFKSAMESQNDAINFLMQSTAQCFQFMMISMQEQPYIPTITSPNEP